MHVKNCDFAISVIIKIFGDLIFAILCFLSNLTLCVFNPRRACAARVTVVVLMYVCVYVCVCVHSYLPPHTLESQKRDTNGFCAIQGSF